MTEFRYHPVNTPIPDGWYLASDMKHSHHGIYSVLIKKIEPVPEFLITPDEVRTLLDGDRRMGKRIKDAIYRLRGGKERRKTTLANGE